MKRFSGFMDLFENKTGPRVVSRRARRCSTQHFPIHIWSLPLPTRVRKFRLWSNLASFLVARFLAVVYHNFLYFLLSSAQQQQGRVSLATQFRSSVPFVRFFVVGAAVHGFEQHQLSTPEMEFSFAVLVVLQILWYFTTQPTKLLRCELDKEKKDESDAPKQQQPPPPSVSLTLDDVNPVGLGRRSRQIFDEVWKKFSGLGQISRTSVDDSLDQVLIRGPMCEFTIPGAQDTMVLVVGATSRIGRIVVRKLMLRGYRVKVLFSIFLPPFMLLHLIPDDFGCLHLLVLLVWMQNVSGEALVRKSDQEVIDLLPRSLSIVIGDVGEPSTLKAAVEGCNKIIYCATARTTITGDLYRVDHQGVYNVTKALQDYNNRLAQLRAGKSSKSKLLIAKFKSAESLDGWEVRLGSYFEDVVASKYDAEMDAEFEFTETGDAVFSGFVYSRGGYVELSKKLSLPLGRTLDRYDGLVLSVGGNGRSYVLILEAGSEISYLFVPACDLIDAISKSVKILITCPVRVPFSSFRPVKPEDPPLDPFLVHTLTIRFEPKRQAGEETLRRSGLGYTIVRPGPLQISARISYA
ncbi:hypothetical protein ACLOJK_030911 [Asimina triloba]